MRYPGQIKNPISETHLYGTVGKWCCCSVIKTAIHLLQWNNLLTCLCWWTKEYGL